MCSPSTPAVSTPRPTGANAICTLQPELLIHHAAISAARILTQMPLMAVFRRLFDAVEKHYGIKIEFTFPDSDEVTSPPPPPPPPPALSPGPSLPFLSLLFPNVTLPARLSEFVLCFGTLTACSARSSSTPRACSPSTRMATRSAAASARCDAWMDPHLMTLLLRCASFLC